MEYLSDVDWEIRKLTYQKQLEHRKLADAYGWEYTYEVATQLRLDPKLFGACTQCNRFGRMFDSKCEGCYEKSLGMKSWDDSEEESDYDTEEEDLSRDW